MSVSVAAAFMIVPANVAMAADNNAKSPNSVIITGAANTAAASDDTSTANKEEVIYASLSSGGTVSQVYAVNHFEMTGVGKVTDYGDYASLINLTDTEPLQREDDAVSFSSGEGDFYYQGNMEATDLPWIFDISYYLDGILTSPEDLAGQSGALEIRMTTKANDKVDPTFYENYMLQISVQLDTGKCDGITAPGGVTASAGKNKMIVYTVMPGKDADMTISATVRDFAMGGIEISGMPFTMGIEMPDTDGMMDDMYALPEAINALDEGVKGLSDGVAGMSDGADQLAAGSTDFSAGLTQFSEKSTELTAASAQINKALSDIAASMTGSGSEINMGDLALLPGGLSQLAEGLDDISGGLQDLKTGYYAAYTALDSAITSIPDEEITESDINGLYGAVTDPDQQAILSRLVEYYASAQKVKGTYAQVQEAFAAVDTSLDTMSGSVDTISESLTGISTQMDAALSGGTDLAGQMQQLAGGLAALSVSYGQFDAGLVQYMDGAGTLASGYSELNSGILSLSGGIDELADGTQELSEGTGKLNESVSDLPEQMQVEIDALMKDYDKSDFEPVSFISEKNKNTSLVQFVFMTNAIEIKEETGAAVTESKELTFWDRLVQLFTKD